MSAQTARRLAASIVAIVFVLEVAAVCLTVGESGLTEAVLYLVYAVTQAGAGGPFASVAQLLDLTSWIVAASGLILLFLLFPDGRLPDRRWRAALWMWGAGAALAIPGWVLSPGLGSDFVGKVNPYARAGAPTGLLFGAGATLVSLALVASVVALVGRLRKARGAERDQIKWIVFAAAVVGVVLPASAGLWLV
jgi:hypothetical protein